MFDIGQQVVCLRDDWDPEQVKRQGVGRLPSKDRIYTIRSIMAEIPGHLGLRFEEIFLAPAPGYVDEPSWDAANFRPLRKTSIEVFTKLLAPTPLTRGKPKQKETV